MPLIMVHMKMTLWPISGKKWKALVENRMQANWWMCGSVQIMRCIYRVFH